MNCTDAGAEKLIPVKRQRHRVPCVPCKGENPRRAGKLGCEGAASGGSHSRRAILRAAVIVKDVGDEGCGRRR